MLKWLKTQVRYPKRLIFMIVVAIFLIATVVSIPLLIITSMKRSGFSADWVIWALLALAIFGLIWFSMARGRKLSISSDFLRLVIGWGVLVAATRIFLVWNDKRADSERVEAASKQNLDSIYLAARLRGAPVIPDSDAAFIYVATASESLILVVREEFCVRTDAENPAESYAYYDQDGRHLIIAGSPRAQLNPPHYFYITAYGGPVTKVRIRTYKKDAQGNCRGPTRNS